MVSLENLVQINDRCIAIWDLNRESDTVFGGLPVVVFLGDFNQFRPVRGHAVWSQIISDVAVLQSGKSIWGHFTRVVILTEQMRRAEDLEISGLTAESAVGHSNRGRCCYSQFAYGREQSCKWGDSA